MEPDNLRCRIRSSTEPGDERFPRIHICSRMKSSRGMYRNHKHHGNRNHSHTRPHDLRIRPTTTAECFGNRINVRELPGKVYRTQVLSNHLCIFLLRNTNLQTHQYKDCQLFPRQHPRRDVGSYKTSCLPHIPSKSLLLQNPREYQSHELEAYFALQSTPLVRTYQTSCLQKVL